MSTIENEYDFCVQAEMSGKRLDLFLVDSLKNVSRNRIQNSIKQNHCIINGIPCSSPKYPVVQNDHVHILLADREKITNVRPENIPINILYEDDDILVINKQAGMVVHPAAGNWSGTVVNAVLDHVSDLDDDNQWDPLRPGIVHRLDKDTSGTLVIAKNAFALQELSKQFAERTISKTYLAIVHGWPVPQAAVIRTYYGRCPNDYKKMMVFRDNRHGEKEAVTSYHVLQQGFWNNSKAAFVEVKLHTGRTHQIRVHMAYLNNPLLGEKLYNKGRTSLAPRQMLHAWKLSFLHPVTKKQLSFTSEIPDDMKQIINEMISQS